MIGSRVSSTIVGGPASAGEMINVVTLAADEFAAHVYRADCSPRAASFFFCSHRASEHADGMPIARGPDTWGVGDSE